MFGLTIDTDSLTWLFQNWGWPQWLILGGIASLWVPHSTLGGLVDKFRSWFQRGILDDEPTPVVPDDIADTAAMIQRLRERRVELQKELDLINDALADGTEIEAA